jgi:hypothetical protein
MMDKSSSTNGCLISLAENFSDDALKLADDNAIVLINGMDLSDLLLAVMMERV